jgi:nitrogen fixation/metabolism regulation signal transduction histidine kinase
MPLNPPSAFRNWRRYWYILLYLMRTMKSTGKVVISSHTDRPDSHDGSISVTITGLGCRISKAESQQLLDPFGMEQFDVIDVGPCIAQKIIEEHGGQLDVRREQGKDCGIAFVIVLPVSKALLEGHTSWAMDNAS